MQSLLKQIFFLISLVISTGVFAQQQGFPEIDLSNFVIPQEEPQEYTIAKINIVGNGTRDENAIKSIARIREGQKITFPSDDIGKGLNGLYKLRLFENVELYQDSTSGDSIYLTLKLIERPTLSRYAFLGVNKTKQDQLKEKVEDILVKGGIVTINNKELSKRKIREYFVDKGFFDVDIDVEEKPDTLRSNAVVLEFKIDVNDRVKVDNIVFEGNDVFSSKKLKKKLKETKKKGTLLKKSKFVKSGYEEDKKSLINFYNRNGYRDMVILSDSITRSDKGDIEIKLTIDEGNQYFYRNVTWTGNTIYNTDQLAAVLGINKGDIYNKEGLEKRLQFSEDGRDISSLYLDQGYLFFNVDPIEVAIAGDSIDIDMRISEGPQATIDQVIVEGNDRTNDHVILRELRTKPGEKFSRSDIIRSQRQLMNLGYFNPETMDIQTPVNQAQGTVDIIYRVEEQPSDQLELSAGYGGASGLIGTLGVTFNNFSIKNIKNKKAWNPLPQGDGQRLSFRYQSNGRFFNALNFSFTEPWLGGKKPNSFTVGYSSSHSNFVTSGNGSLDIRNVFVGLGTRLRFPDDYFTSNSVLNLERIINETGSFNTIGISSGTFYNLNINQTFTRSSISEPIYPRRGSKISLSLQVTPPYSLFRGDDYYILSPGEQEAAIDEANLKRGFLNQLTTAEENNLINDLEEARKFKFLEYYKIRFDTEWFFNFTDKLVMMASAKMGYLSAYNKSLGVSPFERYEFGGDGLSNQNTGLTGKTIIAMRGYDVEDFTNNLDDSGRRTGGTIFNKYTVELRYPLSLNPTSTIYAHAFMQGGNVWADFDDYDPFDLQRSVGFGMRVFLPMFGLLGFDYGFGIDKRLTGNNGYGKFSIILGFEPD